MQRQKEKKVNYTFASMLFICIRKIVLRLQGLEGFVGLVLPLCIPIIQIPEAGRALAVYSVSHCAKHVS